MHGTKEIYSLLDSNEYARESCLADSIQSNQHFLVCSFIRFPRPVKLASKWKKSTSYLGSRKPDMPDVAKYTKYHK